ncbi:MAG: phosphotransferase [Oceanospirillaceae bacterium]|nr:phosphotransferase [Oceanospirillaceae bacterium]
MQQDVFAAVQRHIDADCDWRPFAGGTSNSLYLADNGAEALLLRINAAGSRVPGVDRDREALLLEKMQGRDWAPRVRGCDPRAGWLLMEQHGDVPSAPLAPALRQQLLLAVADWQRMEVPGADFDYPGLFDHYRRQLVGLPLGKALLQLIEVLERNWEGLPRVSKRLTHHDLHPGNLCQRDGRLVVIDWEYGAIGCPWFDAAGLSKQFDASLAELAALPAFAELDTDTLAEGLGQACWMLEALECLWYWARGLSGTGRDMAWLMHETLRLLKTSA